MLMKYLSEYQPWRMRSTSSLKTEAGTRRRSNTLIAIDYMRRHQAGRREGRAEARVRDPKRRVETRARVCSTHPLFRGGGPQVETGAVKDLDVALYRRGRL